MDEGAGERGTVNQRTANAVIPPSLHRTREVMTDSNTSSSFRGLSRRHWLVLAGLGGLGLRVFAWELHRSQDPTHAPSHSHLKHFVPEIRTPKAEQRKIEEQRDRVRHRITSRLGKLKLQVARSPNAGSYAKGTGLRRYMYGNTKIGGSDIDLPFVLTARSGAHLDLKGLLDVFQEIVCTSYSRSKVTRTKSSIKLEFSSFKYPFDIVPMVAVPNDPKREYLFRADGRKIATSVSEHVKFVKIRSARSAESPGIVRFSDMVRLFKWWRELHAVNDTVLRQTHTFLLELLCAKAFDEHGVAPSYSQTLQTWFTAIARIVTERRPVTFEGQRDQSGRGGWVVLDPVSPDNNVVPETWGELQLDQLAQWFWDGATTMKRIEERDADHDGKGALRELQTLFGPAIGNLWLLETLELA